MAKPAATSSTAEITPPWRICRRALPISSGRMSKRSFGAAGSSDSTFRPSTLLNGTPCSNTWRSLASSFAMSCIMLIIPSRCGLQLDQKLAWRNLRTHGHVCGPYADGGRHRQRMLHLHRFEHDERSAGCDRIAGLHVDGNDTAVHRCDKAAVRRGGSAARRRRVCRNVEPEALAAACEMHSVRLNHANSAVVRVECDVLAAYTRPVSATLTNERNLILAQAHRHRACRIVAPRVPLAVACLAR